MRHLKDDRGVALVFELVLVGIVLAVAGLALYQANHTKKVATANTTSPSPSSSPSGSVSPASSAGQVSGSSGPWKTYRSSYEQASFEYPPNWTLNQKTGIDASVPNAYNVTLTSPDGFKVLYQDLVSGLGGGCEPTAPHVVLSVLQNLPSVGAPSSDPVYLIQYPSAIALADKDAWGTAPVLADTGSCLFYPGVTSKVHAQTVMTFGSSFDVNSDQAAIPTKLQGDITLAKIILESFRY